MAETLLPPASISFWPFASVIAGSTVLLIVIVLGRLPRSKLSNGASNTELMNWKSEAQLLQKKLDMVAQDLAASVDQAYILRDSDEIALRQDLARRERSLGVWDETAMDFLDGLERILSHPETSVEQRGAIVSAANQFERLAQRAGLDRIDPMPGDSVIDGHHQIERVIPASKEFEPNTVVKVVTSGYRRGDRVIKLARIVMAEETP